MALRIDDIELDGPLGAEEAAALAGRGDGLKRRLELLELPRPDPAP
jgi:hypothetical protein